MDTRRKSDRMWMLEWFRREAVLYGWQGLSYRQRLRVLWWGLRGGKPLGRFRECIQDRRGLPASYDMTRKAARAW